VNGVEWIRECFSNGFRELESIQKTSSYGVPRFPLYRPRGGCGLHEREKEREAKRKRARGYVVLLLL
jgi:hypothetical protein